ncbi:hypothetical protein QVD17_37799 [Tagetes erecta]|uniref:Secreted protein n=1 Tax=Tagetes erecta TaxID=13708 RepID=A0AAD8JYZ4_TARER|nr:hypothetical protein QVD17_37799 [Tagetes erecta]
MKIHLLFFQRRLSLLLLGLSMVKTQLLLHLEPEAVERHAKYNVPPANWWLMGVQMTEPRSPRPIPCKKDYLRQSVAAPLREEYSSQGPDQPFRRAGKSESKTRQLTAPGENHSRNL